MQNKQLKGEVDVSSVIPVLASAALGGATGGDPKLNLLLTELIEDQLEKRRKEKERKERLALSAVQAAKEERETRERQQRHCAHRKQDGQTRLAGQRLSGTGQVSLVCTFCNKNFYLPPNEALGQVAPPRELIPPSDEVGG